MEQSRDTHRTHGHDLLGIGFLQYLVPSHLLRFLYFLGLGLGGLNHFEFVY